MVNIAVFATFHIVIEGIVRVTAEFKPVCRSRQLDVWRYGWQKRQETARSGNEMARPAAKTARCGGDAATSRPLCLRLPFNASGGFVTIWGCSRCWRRMVAPCE